MMKYTIVFLFAMILVSCNTQKETAIQYGSNPAAGNYADINGIRIYYEIYGEGEPLLLLHGNGGSISSFMYQIPELSKHVKVIAVDSRAQGRSTDSDQEITYALMASDMSELIDKLGLGKVNVVGWSDGGNIGLELAFAHPEKVMKVVALGANYTNENWMAPPDSVVMDADDPLIMRASEMMKRVINEMGTLSLDTARLPVIQKKLEDLMMNYPNFTPEQLRTINVPFLIVAGDHDLINLDLTIALYNSLPKAELFIVPHASHLVAIENPDLINSEIIRFLKTPYTDIDRYYFFKLMQ
ncbi:MAG: alpha/beta hydrolase [Bacteroidales bacterium]|nr:alpha/beta hydrolase [Bacteroidales bacterium]